MCPPPHTYFPRPFIDIAFSTAAARASVAVDFDFTAAFVADTATLFIATMFAPAAFPADRAAEKFMPTPPDPPTGARSMLAVTFLT